jgi:hypothetical protein
MPIPWFPWPHWHQKLQHAEAHNRLATFAICECVSFAEKIKQSDESIPSSGLPAVASGPYLRPDLFGGSFARDGSFS